MTSILVSHPHAATFANGAAAGLSAAGQLASYVTGVATVPGRATEWAFRTVGDFFPILRNRVLTGISSRELSSMAPLEISARIFASLAYRLGNRSLSGYDAMFLSHDRVTSLIPWPRGTDGVLAYEDGALKTFQRAKRQGLRRIWHLPIPHYATLEEMWIQEATRWPGAMGNRPPVEPEWKKRRKDAEFQLADQISVPSLYTAESVERAGAKAPIIVTPFGFPVDDFVAKAKQRPGPFTVIAVGTQNLRKGTPYLLEAWRKANLTDARLRLVGPITLTKQFMDQYAGIFEHVPHVPRTMLPAVFRQADLVVLPTLGDGCPLVVQESMSSGTPVITTRYGNGPDFITSGNNGWIVPGRDVDALVDHLRIAARDRDRTAEIGRAARLRAEQWTWTDSGRALATALAQVTCPV